MRSGGRLGIYLRAGELDSVAGGGRQICAERPFGLLDPMTTSCLWSRKTPRRFRVRFGETPNWPEPAVTGALLTLNEASAVSSAYTASVTLAEALTGLGRLCPGLLTNSKEAAAARFESR